MGHDRIQRTQNLHEHQYSQSESTIELLLLSSDTPNSTKNLYYLFRFLNGFQISFYFWSTMNNKLNLHLPCFMMFGFQRASRLFKRLIFVYRSQYSAQLHTACSLKHVPHHMFWSYPTAYWFRYIFYFIGRLTLAGHMSFHKCWKRHNHCTEKLFHNVSCCDDSREARANNYWDQIKNSLYLFRRLYTS